MLCIICREEKSDMSDEHVIPDAMRGFYHIYSVCKGCNSLLGEQVDSPLVNHKLTELYRFSREVAGKSGQIPNPFSGVYFQECDQDAKFRVDIDDGGQLKIKSLPKVTVNKFCDEIKSIEVSVDSDDESIIDDILKKLAKRHGLPDGAIVTGEKQKILSTEGVKGKWKFDTLKFKIGLLKIAYEFAVDTIDEYFNDSNAIEISKILKTANYELVEDFVKIGNGLQNEVFEPFANYLDLQSEKHYLVLSSSQFGLVCLIKLHDLFAVGVVLSGNDYLDKFSAIVGINDIENKVFKKVTFEELFHQCHGPAHTKFCFHFDTNSEMLLAQKEIDSIGFKCEGSEQDEIPLFDENGKRYPFLLHELLQTLEPIVKYDANWFIQLFQFGISPKFHIKSSGSKKLFRVIAFELSRERIQKI